MIQQLKQFHINLSYLLYSALSRLRTSSGSFSSICISLKIIWDVTPRFLSHSHSLVAQLVAGNTQRYLEILPSQSHSHSHFNSHSQSQSQTLTRSFTVARYLVPQDVSPINNIKHGCRQRQHHATATATATMCLLPTHKTVSDYTRRCLHFVVALYFILSPPSTCHAPFCRERELRDARAREKNELWLLPCKRAGEMSKWQRLIYDYVFERSEIWYSYTHTHTHIVWLFCAPNFQLPTSSISSNSSQSQSRT